MSNLLGMLAAEHMEVLEDANIIAAVTIVRTRSDKGFEETRCRCSDFVTGPILVEEAFLQLSPPPSKENNV